MFVLVRVRLAESGARCGLRLYSRARADTATNTQVTHCSVVVLLTFDLVVVLSVVALVTDVRCSQTVLGKLVARS